MKKYSSVFVFVLTMWISFNSAFSIFLDIDYQKYINKFIANDDSQQIYYAYDTDEESIFLGVFKRFRKDETIDSKIASLNGVKQVYPYTIVKSSENFVKGKGRFISVLIDGEKIDNSLQDDYQSVDEFLLVPYYPEDHYDEHMEKVFITKELAEQLNIKLPSKPFCLSAYYDMPDFKEEQGLYKKEYLKQKIELEISDVLEKYYSSIERSEYAILVPYQKLLELTHSQYDLNIVYTNQSQSTVMEDIKLLDSKIDVYCGTDFFENTVKPNILSSDIPEILANVVLILGLIIFNRYWLKNKHGSCLKQGIINWVIGFMMACVLMRFSRFYAFSSLTNFVLSQFLPSAVLFIIIYVLVFVTLKKRSRS